MTLVELIQRFRVTAGDSVQPYLWGDDDVTSWINEAVDQAAIRRRLIFDDSTPAVCSIALTVGQLVYPLHKSVIEIESLRYISGDCNTPMYVCTRQWLDENVCDWRSLSGVPLRYAVHDDKNLRVAGDFAAGDTLALECHRLPLVSMIADTDEPEIHAVHHPHLIDWVLYRAYSVHDADAFDARRAAQGEADFTRYFGPLPDADMRRDTNADVPPHNEAVLL